MSELERYFMEIFKWGSQEKMVWCGNQFMLGLHQAVRMNSEYAIGEGEKEYGMNVRRFYTPFGTLVIKRHPQFTQIVSGATGGSAYKSIDTWGVVTDMSHLKYIYLKNRDTKYQTDLQEDGVDGKAAGYISEISIRSSHPKTHAVIRGVTGGLKDA